MSKWIGGFLAGASAVALGVMLGQFGKPKKRAIRHRQFRHRFRPNPGWRRSRIENEMLLFLKEARETLQALNNPKVLPVDAEFIEPPNPANAEPTAQEPPPEAKEK